MPESSIFKNKALQTILGLLVILTVVTFCLWPGMKAPLFTDDLHQLRYNDAALTHWTQIFGSDAFNFFRPVKNAIFFAASPFKDDLLAWHTFGLLAYLAATIGVYRITSICFNSPRSAWLATFVWALSPTCVSTAIWLSCANISIGILFAACTFHFHERWSNQHSKVSAIASGLFFMMSLLCYESLIALPALLFFRDLQQGRISIDRKTIIRFGIYLIIALIFLSVRHFYSAKGLIQERIHSGWAADTKPIQVALSAPWFLWRHFLMWFFPFGTIEVLGSYWWLHSASALFLSGAWLFLFVLFGSVGVFWRCLPLIAYGIVFFLIASFPSGNFIPTFNGPINDAYLTIPSIGLAIAFAAGCQRLFQTLKKQKLLGGNEFMILAMLLGFLLFYRIAACGAYFHYWAIVWNKPIEMMLLVSESRPYQINPKASLARYLLENGQIEQAEIIASEVIKMSPRNLTASFTLADIATYKKDQPTAEKYYRIILSDPNLSKSTKKLAQLGLSQNLANKPTHLDEAIELLLKSTNADKQPPTPKIIDTLATAYLNQGNPPKAQAILERELRINPDNKTLLVLLKTINSVSQSTESPKKNQ